MKTIEDTTSDFLGDQVIKLLKDYFPEHLLNEITDVWYSGKGKGIVGIVYTGDSKYPHYYRFKIGYGRTDKIAYGNKEPDPEKFTKEMNMKGFKVVGLQPYNIKRMKNDS